MNWAFKHPVTVGTEDFGPSYLAVHRGLREDFLHLRFRQSARIISSCQDGVRWSLSFQRLREAEDIRLGMRLCLDWTSLRFAMDGPVPGAMSRLAASWGQRYGHEARVYGP